MELKIFQIFYDDSQASYLDEGFIPYFNSSPGNLFENGVIKNIYVNKQYTGADYVGTTSWRVTEKTGLNYEKIKYKIENSDADIYLYGNVTGYPFVSNALRRNRFNFTGKVIARAYEKNVFKYQNPQLNWVTVFCNYWVCKPDIYEKYCNEFLLPMEQFLAEDPVSSTWLNEGLHPHRDGKYPRHPFVYEFLFGLFTYHHLNQLKIEEIPFPSKDSDTQSPSSVNLKSTDMPQSLVLTEQPAIAIKSPVVAPPMKIVRKTKKIVGFYHVFAVNNWLNIVTEQLAILHDTGLYDAATSIHIGFIGGKDELSVLQRLISRFPKITIAVISGNPSDFEFITLKQIVNCAAEDDFYGFYIHTKGVTSGAVPCPVDIKKWRDCLNYYIINKWAWNIEQLNNGYNSSGVQYKDFVKDFPPHYSGNFFWFDSSLISTLKEITPEYCTDRFNAERWLSTSDSWSPANFKVIDQFTDKSTFLPHTRQYSDAEFFQNEVKTGIVLENPDYHIIMENACKKIASLNVKSVVDIGSGTGVMVNILNAQYRIQTTGVDPNIHHFLYATAPERCDDSLITKYQIGTLDNITDYADVYVAIEVFEHIDHAKIKAFLCKAARRCKYFYFSSSPMSHSEEFDVLLGRINVKPVELWIKLFDECGFEVYDLPKMPTPWSIIFRSKPFRPVH